MLDIGFGDGASLLRAAEGGAARVIGVEPHAPGVGVALRALAAARVENCRVVRGDALELLAALAGDEGADDRRGSILAEWYDGLKIGEDPPPWYGSIDPNWDRLRYEDETGNLASDWDRAYFGEAPPSKVPLAVALAGANKRARAAAPPAGLHAQLFFPDPWPAPKDAHRRLFRAALLEGLRGAAAALGADAGASIHLATDVPVYAAHARDVAAEARWREVAAPARPETRYELRAREAGRLVTDVCFESPS